MRLTCGVGYDSKGFHKATISRKKTKAYQTWVNMMIRCYSENYHKKKPTYIGCSVAKEWHDFQNFADWFNLQKYKDLPYELDKDLLSPNNKIYSSKTCCLVPRDLNVLLIDSRSVRGDCPQGVDLVRSTGKYRAQLSINGSHVHLGWFNSPSEAHQIYKRAKERYVKNKALEWANRIDWCVFVALMNWQLAQSSEL